MNKKPGGTAALDLLTQASVQHEIHRYEHDPAHASFGLEAAEKLEVDSGRVFKTLIALVDAKLTVALVPVTSQLDLKALASSAGGKSATMSEPAAAERSSGYVVGAISPLGQKKVLPTIIDTSAQEYETIYVSAGKRGLEVSLSPDDLAVLTKAKFHPIAK